MNSYARQLLIRAVFIEGGLLGIAIIGAYFQESPWWHPFTPTLVSCGIGIGAGIGLLTMNYLAVEYGSRYLPFFRVLKQLLEEDVAPLFKNIPLGVVVVIAIVSGIAEEAFFRGFLQPLIGLWLASLIFGLAHIWRKMAMRYGLYAAVIGLYFGGLYALTGNLWTPVLAHSVNNLVAILYYRQLPALSSEQSIVDVVK